VTGLGQRRTISIRESRHLDEFAAELRRRLQAPVVLFDGYPRREPSGGQLLMCRPEVFDHLPSAWQADPRVRARMVLFDVERSRGLEWAERFGLAAVIDTARYLRWQNRRDSETAEGLYGRKDVARAMGAQWEEPSVFTGERYALLSQPGLRDLPGLLGAYLRQYARTALG
jgi:hypothetical protein